VNILLTCANNRNDDKTSTFMDGGPPNRGRGSDLTACLVGLRSHSRLHRGRCLTRTGPKYVGSLVCTEVEGIDNIYAPVIIRHLSIGITTVTVIKIIIKNTLV
jgi:hypothetical protein